MDRLADISAFEAVMNSGFDSVYNDWRNDMWSGARSLGKGLFGGVGALGRGIARGASAVGKIGAAVGRGAYQGYQGYKTAGTQDTAVPQQQPPQQQPPQQQPPQQQPPQQRNIKAGGIRKAMYLCQACSKQLADLQGLLRGSVADATGMMAGGAANNRDAILSAAERFSLLAPSVYNTLKRLYA